MSEMGRHGNVFKNLETTVMISGYSIDIEIGYIISFFVVSIVCISADCSGDAEFPAIGRGDVME